MIVNVMVVSATPPVPGDSLWTASYWTAGTADARHRSSCSPSAGLISCHREILMIGSIRLHIRWMNSEMLIIAPLMLTTPGVSFTKSSETSC